MTDKQRQETYAQMLVRLSRSNFRSRFHLKAQDKQYIREKGWNTIADHAPISFPSACTGRAEKRRQADTHARHPVFITQHATACCCRGCLAKWHNIPQGVQLTVQQQHYIVSVIHHWLVIQMNSQI